MEIIVPAAGLSTRFPNMRPKYTLTDYKGQMMFERAIEYYVGKYNVTIGVLMGKTNDQVDSIRTSWNRYRKTPSKSEYIENLIATLK